MRYKRLVNGRRVGSDVATSPGIACEIGEASDWGCVYCGFDGSQIDHVVPWIRGGPNIRENKVLACRRCNGRKSDKVELKWLIPAFMAILKRGDSLDWLKDWRDVSTNLNTGAMSGGHWLQGRDDATA